MSWKYTENREDMGRYLNHEPALREELHRRAGLGLAVAVALAPKRTGELARSGHVQDDGPNNGFHHDRMQYSIVFDVGYAVPETYRTRYHDPHKDYLLAVLSIVRAG